MAKIITFGEVMLRLSPPGYQRIAQATAFERTFGGAEVNVAVSLSQFGHHAAFVTKLPQNAVAESCVRELRGLGVDTTTILRGGERIGVYFVEKGAAQRASTVLYDRAHSAIAEATPTEWDWQTILAGADAFHVTGITPALSEACTDATRDVLQAAKAAGILTTCDLNFRKKLWTSEQAGKTMGELLPFVDYVIANEEDAESVFGIKAAGTDHTTGTLSQDGYVSVAEQLTARFGCKGVAITLRESFSASRNGWGGLLYTGGAAHFSPRYDIAVVDRVGGGDAFAAGLLHGLLTGKTPADTVAFAAAASCLKHSIPGDYNLVSLAEVETLLAGDGSGRVQR